MPVTSPTDPAVTRWPVPAVFFDLDGTLVDPAGGITSGIAHALAAHGLPVPPDDVLPRFVGPPLALGLRRIAGVPERLLADVVAEYRSYYAAHAIPASRVYPGMRRALSALRRAGMRLAVTTSKTGDMATRLLAHHGLEDCFDAVVGSTPEQLEHPGADGSKVPQIRAAARALGIDPSEAAVVGDRHYDIDAASATGAIGIGVSWGFAPPGELEAAGAAVIVENPDHLPRLLPGPTVTRASKETA